MTVSTDTKTFIVNGINEGQQNIAQTILFDGSTDWRINLISGNGQYFFQVDKVGTVDIY